jgi:hypothetical protein
MLAAESAGESDAQSQVAHLQMALPRDRGFSRSNGSANADR